MSKSIDFPDCYNYKPPITITPSAPTPNHSLYLSNLDDLMYQRLYFSEIYIFKKSVKADILKSSLSRVLVDYYPVAGRLRTSSEDENKLVVDCNGEGVLFAEASMDITAEELLIPCMTQHKSLKKLKCKGNTKKMLDNPLLLIQVTNLRCGGMMLFISFNHVLLDGTGISQFLNDWAHLTKNPNSNLTIKPYHNREMLKIREPPQIKVPHPVYIKKPEHTNPERNYFMWFITQTIVHTSITFGANEILRLRKQCTTSLFKYVTDFEVILAHTWRSMTKSLNMSPTRVVNICFTANIRKKLKLPKGFYGNAFIIVSAESTVKDLVNSNNLDYCIKCVQQAKSYLDDEEYIRSSIDLLKDKTLIVNESTNAFVSQLNKLGIQDLDFGEGKPFHVDTFGINSCAYFLPVIGDPNAVRVMIPIPKNLVDKYHHYMTEIECWEQDE
ncbi:alcohol acyl transferase 1 allele RGb-like [Cicer arietinum]|uniref:Fatty alcohol:caffeoyl-CoA acyltransferase-like n=1 Tax=Cicer arietinum TaxID=3827 RepID=A0A1S2Z2M0_CICAR|nr:fatty alcohol:caffeoyl-CoA acyltransferase-like [Cicer arietinum]